MSRKKEIEYVVDENGCHICTSHVLENGYPRFMRDGKKKLISNYVYEQNYGEIPPKMRVRHKCDNPRCINPKHLELGTHDDNMKDMVVRGRVSNGESHHLHKLTEEDVRFIREKSSEMSQSQLARMFNVSQPTIYSIILGTSWKHIK